MTEARPATRGERAADRVASFVGSWRFIVVQTVIVAAWMTLNTVALVHHWDPLPFVLLNLVFSTQAAYAAPILQLSGNRQTEKIERLAESTNDVVRKLLANDALAEQTARNEADMLAALLELVKAHAPDDSR